MEKKIIFSILTAIVVAITVLLMLPDDNVNNTPATLPWHITHPIPGTLKVFGITLGKTTLEEAEKMLKTEAQIAMFKSKDGKKAIEGFIEEVNFNGLKAKVAFTIDISPEDLEIMYERGKSIGNSPSGKRITLLIEDNTIVRQSPIVAIGYLPHTRIDEDVLIKRFGEPAQRVREIENGVIHWLYPEHALDLVPGGEEKPMLQYIAPKDFELLRAPLLANGEVLE